MELNEKLLNLRNSKGLTQQQLADILYVSRTAISKWESGRGVPSIESLKEISKFFSVSIDELLSGEQLLDVAEQNNKKNITNIRDLVFGLIDCGISLLIFLPLFCEKAAETVRAISLFDLTEIQLYLKIVYFVVVFALVLFGVLTLAMQNCQRVFWVNNKNIISLILSIVALNVFVLSRQPYASVFVLSFFVIKVLMLIKWR